MMRRRNLLLLCAEALLLAACAVVWWRFVPLRDGVYVVGNDRIAWHIEIASNVLRTVCLENRDTGERLAVSGDDFVLRIGTAAAIGWAKEYKKPGEDWAPLMVRDAAQIRPASCKPLWLVRGRHTWRFILREPSRDCTIELLFDASPGAPWLRRRIVLKARGQKELAVDGALHVQWKTAAKPSHGGIGQPVYLDYAWFLALEHPYGSNECVNGMVTLRQYPGHGFGTSGIALQSMVVGASAPGDIRTVMDAYVDTIRQPPRSLSLYNSWCDLRAENLTQTNIEKSAGAIAQNLQRYGGTLDVIAVDDGWFLPKSIWDFDPVKLPEGFDGLKKAVGGWGMRTGLWLPLSGHSLNTAWGGERGYEVASPRYYCMSGSNYQSALREQLRAIMKDGDIRYFKHDFNFFWCGWCGHGHFPSKEQSTEANVDVLLSLLEMEQREKPGIFLAATTGTWPSPWWLTRADCIWMGGNDHDYNRRLPCSRGSVFEMNYRDGALYAMLVEQQLVFPLQALMTHGIVDARHTPYSMKQEDDEGWANYVMNYLGRGTMMRECYLTPENLTQIRWEILARGLSWAASLDDCMVRAHFVLGDPRKGELFGYAGGSGARRYASLRNAGVASANVAWSGIEFTGGIYEIVYPWHEWRDPAESANIDVPGESVVQAMNYPADALRRPVPVGIRAVAISNMATETIYELQVPPGVTSFDVVSPVALRSINGGGIAGADIEKGGKRAQVRLASGLAEPRVDIEEASFNAHGVFHCRAMVAGSATLRLRVLVNNYTPVTPVAYLNGKQVVVTSFSGDGWQLATVECQRGTNDVRMGLQGSGAEATKITVQAFASQEMQCRPVTVRIQHGKVKTAGDDPRPVPLLQDVVRATTALAEPTVVLFDAKSMMVKVERVLGEQELRTATRAWLKYDVFDANGGQYADKRMSLNGVAIGLLATNPPPVSTWTAVEMPLPDEAVRALKLDNIFSVEDRTGDAYKVRAFRVVVELPDGRQVSTEQDPMTYSSSMSWQHKEGSQLPLGGSSATTLSF